MAFDMKNSNSRRRPTGPLLMLELNEVNVEDVIKYANSGHLPNFSRFFAENGYSTTSSEAEYDHLEPWIQWVTAHTGRDFAEHGVFRLGDIINLDIPQIWEQLEAQGLTVGAISPMNAKYRLDNPAFFVPDPWTRTDVVAPGVLRRLYEAIAEAVNENANSTFGAKAALNLAVGGLAYARPANYARYLRLVAQAKLRPWAKALFLDLLLSDVFIRCMRAKRPDFASLFLNAGAHIQHHYMYSSGVYEGAFRNPDWYVPKGVDPLLDVYSLYDGILGDVRAAFPNIRIMLATGLHQEPHTELTYYWRLKDHADFLRRIGAHFETVEPRMSRDFLVVCRDAEQAKATQATLEAVGTPDGTALFEVDNRGADLFVMLTWSDDIPGDVVFGAGGRSFGPLRPHVAFVAIKNGRHNGIGYFSDSGAPTGQGTEQFPLKDMPQLVSRALGVAATLP